MPLQGSTANQLTYTTYDLMTGTLLEELPFQQVTFTQRLNIAGEFTGALNFLDTRLRNLSPGQVLQPGRTALFIDYAGVIIWGGIIMTVNFQRTTAGSVQVRGKEFYSYFANRVQAKDYTNPTWPVTTVAGVSACGDPMVIAATVVTDALSISNSAMNPSGPFPLTINQNNGVPTPAADWVAVSYPITQLQTLQTIVDNLCQMGYGAGFDHAISATYNSSGYPTLAWNLSYPRSGRLANASSVVVVTQAANEYTYPQDATQQANLIWATGSGSGGARQSASNPSAISAGWPLLEKVNSYSNITSSTVLTQVAQEDLAKQSYPVTVPTVKIPMFGDPLPFMYQIGDDIRWIIESDERFPMGVDYNWRIVGIDWKPSDEGLSIVQFTLNLPPVSGSLVPEPPT